jgi:hypothetical protein
VIFDDHVRRPGKLIDSVACRDYGPTLFSAMIRLHDLRAPRVDAGLSLRVRNAKLRDLVARLQDASVHELAGLRTLLRRIELDASNHYFNAERTEGHLARYIEAAPALLSAQGTKDRRILEFGSGTRNAVSLGALLLVNGAREVLCYEPGKVNLPQSGQAFDQLMIDVMRQPERFALPGVDPSHLPERASELLQLGERAEGLRLITSREEVERLGSDIDLVLSNHVLEHVQDLPTEMRLLRAVTAEDGRHVHRVDFRDHRSFGGGGKGLFAFYEDGALTTCNGLRPPDVERCFEQAGLRFERRKIGRVPPEAMPERVVPPFTGYSREVLRTTYVDYVLSPA